jgi:hypothetical protein
VDPEERTSSSLEAKTFLNTLITNITHLCSSFKETYENETGKTIVMYILNLSILKCSHNLGLPKSKVHPLHTTKALRPGERRYSSFILGTIWG